MKNLAFINAWNSRARIVAIARRFSMTERQAALKARLLRAQGIYMADKRGTRFPELTGRDKREFETLALWVAFKYGTSLEEIKGRRRFRKHVQIARRVLATALWEAGFSDLQIVGLVLGKNQRGDHTSAVYWRQRTTINEHQLAFDALAECKIPPRRTQVEAA